MAKAKVTRNGDKPSGDALPLPAVAGAEQPDASDVTGDGASSGEILNPTIDPGTIGDQPGDSLPNGKPRQRARRSDAGKPKSASKTKTQTDLTGLLLSLHSMLAAFISVPELELTEAEAEKLNAGVVAVQEAYDWKIVSPKAAAITQLTMAIGEVYGPRFVALALTPKKKSGPIPIDGDGKVTFTETLN